jgi:hypothetical protein
MFATMHPWDVKNDLKFTSADFVAECCASKEKLVPTERVDTTRAEELAARLWIWIVPARQDDMTMGRAHLGVVWNALKGGTP